MGPITISAPFTVIFAWKLRAFSIRNWLAAFWDIIRPGWPQCSMTAMVWPWTNDFSAKNWAKRPLSQEMLAYAAGDVAYLLPLANVLKEELKAKNRLAWVTEECELLSQVRAPEKNGEPLFLRFKGAGTLRSAQLINFGGNASDSGHHCGPKRPARL